MAASVQFRQQERNLGVAMEDKKDDDLALFLDLQSRQNEKNEVLLLGSVDFDDQLGTTRKDRSLISRTSIIVPPRKTGVDAFLNSENDKTDYDCKALSLTPASPENFQLCDVCIEKYSISSGISSHFIRQRVVSSTRTNRCTSNDRLITPPDTPLFPSLETEPNSTVLRPIAISNGHPIAPEPRLADLALKKSEASKNLISNGSNSSISSNKRPLSSGSNASRPLTPTIFSTTKPSRPSTPTSRPSLPSTTKPTRSNTPTSRASSRSNTPTSRASLPSTTKPVRSNTSTFRASLSSSTKPSRSSTPTSRASFPSTTKPTRSSTPTSNATSTKNSRPSTPTSRATSAKNSRPSTPTSRATLPTIKPLATIVRSSTPTRSSSVTKCGPKIVKNSEVPPNVRSSSNGRTRQVQKTSNGNAPSNAFSVLAMSRGRSIEGDDVNPVLMGTQMVERVVNMRKLAPPKVDDHNSSNYSGKSFSSQENLGRTLSKTSLDMAIRHMDIGRSVQGKLRPLVTNIPASSVYSVRSGSSTKSKRISALDSPLATSSNASSEPSVHNGSIELYDNDFGSERAFVSPPSE